MRRIRTATGLAAAALALLAVPAGADERVDGMVEALRRDPVFVSTAVSRAVPAADAAALRRAVRGAPFPVYVVIAPSYGDEAGLETLDALPDLLHDGLDRDGLYLVVNGAYGTGVVAQTFAVRSRTELRDLPNDVFDDRRGSRPAEIARYALALVVSGRRDARRAERTESAGRAGTVLGALGLGLGTGLVAFTGAGWPYLTGRRRRRREFLAARAALEPAPDATTATDEEAERERARAGVLRLSSALAAASSPPATAFDDYAAASKLLDEARDPVALVAASTLVDAGEWLLDGSTARSCFFDPRHGKGTKETRWRLGGEEAALPACKACAKAIARGHAPVALEDRGRPYFERDTLWARTGLGALEDGLAVRVLAGEWRR